MALRASSTGLFVARSSRKAAALIAASSSVSDPVTS